MRTRKGSPSMTVEDAEKIVQDYGAAWRSVARPGNVVRDIRNLPHPKEHIKQALILSLLLNTDPKGREILKVAYILLADWQEGVGNIPVGLDMTGVNLNGDPIELAERVAEPLRRMVKWQPVVNEEQEVLKSELQKLGLWEVTNAGQ
jgi:hypothetical protein